LKLLNRIKSSFIQRIFLSLFLVFVLLFISAFFIQGIIFENYFVKNTVSKNINLINELLDSTDVSTINDDLISYMKESNTTSILTPSSEFNEGLITLSLIEVTVSDGNDEYMIFAPNNEYTDIQIGQAVSSVSYSTSIGQYIPVYLQIGTDVLINSRMGMISDIYQDFIPDINPQSRTVIRGDVTNISLQSETSNTLHPIISNEILNIITQNYKDVGNFSNGFYYTTTDSANQNLVFLATSTINSEDYILLSVYSMENIEFAVRNASLINIYIFVVIFSILLIASFIYTREFSKPIKFINKQAEKMSNLDFSSEQIDYNYNDEFGELVRNINTLGANLEFSIQDIEEKNEMIIKNIENELSVEKNKRDFISGLSHEIKTPLAVIQAAAEALENDIFTEESDKKEQLKLIQNEVSRTNSLILKMLDVYQITDIGNSQRKIDLADTLSKSIESHQSMMSIKNINLILQTEEAFFVCEDDKFELVFSNLISNAVKYSPIDAELQLSLSVNKDIITFTIKNYGAQIPERDLDNIFEPFYRGDKSRNRNDGGSGLGLYLVNQILKTYGSECKVKSNDNSVEFFFELIAD